MTARRGDVTAASTPTTLSVTVLGCSGTYAAAGGACSGYLLRTRTTSVWVDCGPGTLANIQRHVALGDLDGIVCSHQHPDHWLELPVVVNAFRYGLRRPDRRLPLLWTAGTADLFEHLAGDPSPTFAPAVVSDGATATVGDIEFRFGRTDHPVETMAVRASSAGRTLVYSADTGNDWSLADLGPGIDLALVEATLDEAQLDEVQHLTAAQAGWQASEAGVASLVLTHLAPGTDPAARLAEAAAVYDGPVRVASVGDVFTV